MLRDGSLIARRVQLKGRHVLLVSVLLCSAHDVGFGWSYALSPEKFLAG